MKYQTVRYALGIGSLFCAAVIASADDSVATFRVDLTAAATNGTFTPGTSHVFARGSFNNWSTGAFYDGSGSSQLTNNASAIGLATNIYSGTFHDTNDANASTLSYKYYIDTGTAWENDPNRSASLPGASGASITLAKVYFNNINPVSPTPPVDSIITFRVDMTAAATNGIFDPTSSQVFARGSFNNWTTGEFFDGSGSSLLTNNPAASGLGTNIYSGTFHDTNDNNGVTLNYKYYVDTGTHWEDDPNKTATLPGTSGDSVTVATRYFNNIVPSILPPVTNDVVFQVNMAVQTSIGNFVPGSSTVYARGSFEGWGTDFPLTNNPSAVGSATNIYSGTYTITDTPHLKEHFKFFIDTGNGIYESPLPANVDNTGNRFFNLLNANGPLVLPLLYFSDLDSGSDLLPVDTAVTLRIDMTGAVATDSHAFDASVDRVFINGDFLGWQGWNDTLPEVTNNPVGSAIYTITLTIPHANPVALTYKYSINGPDNEAAAAQNHFRYIRTTLNYTMPVDKFGNQYAEPSFGQLSIGAASTGHVPVSWLGRPGVHLQTAAALGAAWQDRFETDGTNWTSGVSSTNGFISITNYPVGAGATFFRLIKPL